MIRLTISFSLSVLAWWLLTDADDEGGSHEA